MPVVPEDIWMHILQLREVDDFLIERDRTGIAIGSRSSDWGPNIPTPSAVTRLKPISAKFSATCVQWRKTVLATSACWVTTVDIPMESPLLETVLQSSLQFRLASDIDIYIDEGNINSEEISSVSLKVSRLMEILLDHLGRWRSLMLINMENQDIPAIIDGLSNPAGLATRLISLDVLCSPGPKPTSTGEKRSFICTRLPALRRLHIDTACKSISIGHMASFPNVSYVSMPNYWVHTESLLCAISQANHLKSLILHCYDKLLDLEAEFPVLTGLPSVPLVSGAQFALPFLTMLKIQMCIQNVLPLLRLIELSELKTLVIHTGDSEDNPDISIPIEGNPVNLPSLFTFKIRGKALMENHISMVSHLWMSSLTRLRISSGDGNFEGDLRKRKLPFVHLPSLNTMTLSPAPACSDFGIFFRTPNLQTLVLSAGPLPSAKQEYECFPGSKTSSFPMLRTLEIYNYTPMGIDAFLNSHDLPSLAEVNIRLQKLDPFYALSVWEKFFERQRMVMAKLQKFELRPIPEDLQGLLSQYAPHLRPQKSSGVFWSGENA